MSNITNEEPAFVLLVVGKKASVISVDWLSCKYVLSAGVGDELYLNQCTHSSTEDPCTVRLS